MASPLQSVVALIAQEPIPLIPIGASRASSSRAKRSTAWEGDVKLSSTV
jgi:hypothetical protein